MMTTVMVTTVMVTIVQWKCSGHKLMRTFFGWGAANIGKVQAVRGEN